MSFFCLPADFLSRATVTMTWHQIVHLHPIWNKHSAFLKIDGPFTFYSNVVHFFRYVNNVVSSFAHAAYGLLTLAFSGKIMGATLFFQLHFQVMGIFSVCDSATLYCSVWFFFIFFFCLDSIVNIWMSFCFISLTFIFCLFVFGNILFCFVMVALYAVLYVIHVNITSTLVIFVWKICYYLFKK